MAVDANYRSSDMFLVEVQCEASGTPFKVFDSDAPAKFRVLDMWGYMTGAGAASDTVKLTDGSSDIVTAIAVNAASDKDVIRAAEIDHAKNEISAGGSLHVVTASGALCKVFILCEWTD